MGQRELHFVLGLEASHALSSDSGDSVLLLDKVWNMHHLRTNDPGGEAECHLSLTE